MHRNVTNSHRAPFAAIVEGGHTFGGTVNELVGKDNVPWPVFFLQ